MGAKGGERRLKTMLRSAKQAKEDDSVASTSDREVEGDVE
jgi:hypothetical protein